MALRVTGSLTPPGGRGSRVLVSSEGGVPGVLTLIATQSSANELDIFRNIFDSRGVVLSVLLVLIGMSVACWLIIAYKWLWFVRLRRASRLFADVYWKAQHPNDVYDSAKRGPPCPQSRIFVAAYRELSHLRSRGVTSASEGGFENVQRAVHRAQTSEVTGLERWLGFLGTTGSTAPFIGLFGTVWGIMRAFAGLGQLDAEANLLTTVTPHIAEALVATAIGLLAAIPAVMAYNYFVNQVRRTVADMEDFGADYLNNLRRLFFTG